MHYPSISLILNIMCIKTFSDHLNVLYIFDQTDLDRVEVRLERLVVSPPSLSPSHPAKPMASSRRFIPRRLGSARLAPLV